MPITSKYLFVVSMDVDPDKEDLFNEVYDTEHIPNLSKVPGVQAEENDLILDLESVTVNGQRYAIRTDATRVESRRDDSLVGAIVGAINGGEYRGRAVRIPRDSVVTFRLQRPLDVGVEDRGIMRDGRHYHDYQDRP